MADKMIDAKGLRCPMPIVKISREMKKITAGQTLEVRSDDPAFGEDVKAFCEITKSKLDDLYVRGDVYVAVITKSSA